MRVISFVCALSKPSESSGCSEAKKKSEISMLVFSFKFEYIFNPLTHREPPSEPSRLTDSTKHIAPSNFLSRNIKL